MRLPNWLWSMKTSSLKCKWFAICAASIGILTCNKEEFSTSLFSTKVKKSRKKYSLKTQFSLRNNSKPIHCSKSSPKNPALRNLKLTLLLPSLPSVKAQSSPSHKQLQVQSQTMPQAIHCQPIHASRKLWTDFVQLWLIWLTCRESWTSSLTGKKLWSRKLHLMIVKWRKSSRMEFWR